MFFPNPRYRIYGAPRSFLHTARDAAFGRLSSGDGTADLEAAAAGYLGVTHAVAMPQARVALYVALRALLTNPAKRQVIMSPYTIHDVVNMVVCAGGEPVFADIGVDANIDPSAIEHLTGDATGAILVTHLHGLACDIERIAAWAARHRLPLIEDCAQAFGTRVGGRPVGSFGTVGVFSFGMAKNINAYFGGLAVSSDPELAGAMRRQLAEAPAFDSRRLLDRAVFCAAGQAMTSRPVFWSSVYWIFRYGFLHNIDALTNQWRGEMEPALKTSLPDGYLQRMTPAQARLAAAQIGGVDRDTAVRIAYAERYADGLSGVAEVIVPPRRTDGSHIYLTYPIQVPDRVALNRFLMREYQDITIQHLTNTADADCYRRWFRDCPQARATADAVLLLPTYPSYGVRNVMRNVELIRRFYHA